MMDMEARHLPIMDIDTKLTIDMDRVRCELVDRFYTMMKDDVRKSVAEIIAKEFADKVREAARRVIAEDNPFGDGRSYEQIVRDVIVRKERASYQSRETTRIERIVDNIINEHFRKIEHRVSEMIMSDFAKAFAKRFVQDLLRIVTGTVHELLLKEGVES